MAEERDYEHILTQLYTRKLTRKAWNMIAADYKAQTGADLCELVVEAQKEIINDIKNIPKGKIGADARTKLYKMIDYGTYVRFCKLKK